MKNLNMQPLYNLAYSAYQSAKNILGSWFKSRDIPNHESYDINNSYIKIITDDPVEPQTNLVEPAPVEKVQIAAEDEKDRCTRFKFRDALLDRLDEHFYYIKSMKKSDIKSYNMFKTAGGVLTNADIIASGEVAKGEFYVSDWFKTVMPSFGCVLFITEKQQDQKDMPNTTDKTFPRMMYFRKYDKPPVEIQPIHEPGSVYVCGIYWHNVKGYKYSTTTEYAVHVSPNGYVKLLNMKISEIVRFTTRKQNGYGKGECSLRRERWGIPDFYKDIFNDMGMKDGLLWLFASTARQFEIHSLQEMIDVKATKNGISATFGVDIERTPYFFKDREANYVDGKKKRIFHIVRPHERVMGDGNVKVIKTHFRGDKEFMWNGYKISINIPEREKSWRHFDMSIGGHDVDDVDVNGNYMDFDEAIQSIEKKRMDNMASH